MTRYAYDRADNLIRLEEPDSNVHGLRYDAMGNMIHASDNIREVRFTYGALGVLKSREQDRHWITFGYNSELQLRRIGIEAGDNYFFEAGRGWDGSLRKPASTACSVNTSATVRAVTRVNRPRKMDGIPV
ncbi:hypothetical protein NXW50_13700 [Bacteroides thetaiotaomicron]|nr:hypothetical protein [Bacteroides thetaiotaomicron]MCS2279203.1 hypothetical protein [Bacteroides thetaiotaomicron]